MNKPFKIILGVLGGLALLVLILFTIVSVRGVPNYKPEKPDLKVALTPERIEHGRKMVTMLCIDCHANPETRQLTGTLVPDLPTEFGKVYSRNITQHPETGIGKWTDGQIAYMLRTGITADGNFVPFMPKFNLISDEDIASIIAFLRSDTYAVKAAANEPPASEYSFLAKALCNFVIKPVEFTRQPISTPAITDQVAYGKYLVDSRLQCFACHSKDFKTLNEADPTKSEGYLAGGNPMVERDKKEILTANITMDPETGIGKLTEEQFVKTLREGRMPDGRALRYPMQPYSLLEEAEAKAIYAYLKTVPPVQNKIDRELSFVKQ
jgi:hypothetical protein